MLHKSVPQNAPVIMGILKHRDFEYPNILAMGILSTMPFFNHGDFEHGHFECLPLNSSMSMDVVLKVFV